MFPRKMIPPGFVEDLYERFSAGGPEQSSGLSITAIL